MTIRRTKRALSLRTSIAASKRKLLREISGSCDVTFITSRGNIGDHLIHAGTRQLLSGILYKETTVRKHREAGIQGLEGIQGHTALVTGGGGWCRPFHRIWPTVLPLIERRFEKVIVLPSTVDTSFDLVREVLAQTKALVFARERESYRQLRGLCKTDIAHDCAFFFDFGPYRSRGKGLLTAYRTDAESASGGETPPGNDDISKSCESLDEWLWTIAHHEAVETDRAHVMIAAAMLGKKVRYRASNYHKVPAIAEYALRGFPVEHILEEDDFTRPRHVGDLR
jgi:exopolysaccharide biosynthesis predicted pyruvyltransferase EpsI